MKIITGHQPVYLPWLGLFHKISLADTFVFMDDVQYLEQDWNNRNRLKGPNGAFWLTVPVRMSISASKLIRDIVIEQEGWKTSKRHWQRKHWQSLQFSYRKAPYWDQHAPFFEQLYTHKSWKWLVELNERILNYLLDVLNMKIEFIRATDYGFSGYKSDLVLDHCRKLDGNVCVLGTNGRSYIREEDFFRAGISVYYQDYKHPQYEQIFGEFISHLSIVDLLFNCGPASREILLGNNIRKTDLMHQTSLLNEPRVFESSDGDQR